MKNLWIINHNATPPQFAGLCRHYYFSKYLKQKGYNVRIITASTIHNTKVNMIEDKSLFIEKEMDAVPYTFLKCSEYAGNGLSRIRNMLEFPLRIWQVYKHFEKPDIIYASSPDPFSALSAFILAKWLKVPRILEVRDLWPESIVEYTGRSRKNPVIQMLYLLEKWLYIKADRLIFTIPGGYEYIKERGLQKKVLEEKVFYINNGVDLDLFDYNRDQFQINDELLEDKHLFKIVYTGSIRLVNHIEMLVYLAEELKSQKEIKFVVFGNGTEKKELEEICAKKKLDNIIFKGSVEKQYIPYILSHAGLLFLDGVDIPLMKYGCSPNKLFDYFAAARPVFSFFTSQYDLIAQYGCGTAFKAFNTEEAKAMVLSYYQMKPGQYENYCENSRKVAQRYDYKELANQVAAILMDTVGENLSGKGDECDQHFDYSGGSRCVT